MKLKRLSLSLITTVLLSNYAMGATALPYYNECNDLSTVTAQKESDSRGWEWQVATYQGNSVFKCKQSSTSVDRAVHATIWTPALDIEDGKLYKVSVAVGSVQTPPESKVELSMMASPVSSAAKTVLLEVTPLPTFSTNNRPEPLEQIFVGDSSKPYFAIIDAGGGYVGDFAVDDIKVEEYNGGVPPAMVTNLTSNVVGKVATINFTLPSDNILGTPIQGSISSVTLLREDMPVKTWENQQPGAALSFSDAVSTAGEYVYTVVCSTGEGMESRAGITVKVAGNQVPSVCKGYDKDENGDYIGMNYFAPAVYVPGQGIKLSWKASNPEAKYSVMRVGDNKVIASKTSDLEVIDSDIDLSSPQTYQYIIYTDNGNGRVVLYNSSVVSMNNTVPFQPGLSSESLNEFTIVDLDKDVSTWGFTSGSADKHGVNRYFSNTRCGDDWLITPGVSLQAGKTYLVEIDALCGSIIEQNVKFQLLAGSSNNINSLTEELIPGTILNHLKPRTYQTYYNPSESGNVFFAIRSLDPNGNHSFNDLGISGITISEVPLTTPAKVDDLTMEYSTTPGNGNLVFTAPSKDVSGNALAKITKIDVYNDDTLIKTIENATPGTQYKVDVTFPLASRVQFRVESYSDEAKSLDTKLEVMLLTAPYTNEFNDETDAQGFTVIDPLLLGYSWGYQSILNAMRSYKPIGSTQDDYLIMPSLYLEAGNFYKIDFTTWLYTADTYGDYNNSIEVLIGKQPTVESLTDTIVTPYIVRGGRDDVVLLKDWFSVPESGVYYLAWHVKSEPRLAQELYIDNINIGEKFPDTYPAGVDNFKITPDSEGAPEAVISFDLPVKDMAGRNLTSNFYGYAIYRDGFEVSKGEGEVGKHIDYHDSTTPGVHLYTVRCFGAENKPTRDIENIAYIGINRPGPVEFVEVSENPDRYGEITLTWGVPEADIDGFPLNTTNITYTVGQYYLDPYTGVAQEIEYANGVTGLSYTKAIKSEKDQQEFMRFFVRANTIAGKGNPTVLTKWSAIGTPFSLPFVESFPNGNPKHTMMQERPFEGKYASWGYNTENPVTGVKPVDNDKGLAMMETIEQGSGARLFTLRVNLDADNPVMTFYVYNQTNASRTDNNYLGISIREGNGEFNTIAEMSVNEWAKGSPGWQKASVDLSEYAHKVVYIGFDGIAVNMTFIHVDNIVVDAPVETDIALGAVSHEKIYVGVGHEIALPVHNMGSKDVTDITINLKLDGKTLESRKIDKLESGKEEILTFNNLLGRDAIGKHVYTAEAIVANDADMNNNTSTGPSFYLHENNFPTVENLKATDEIEKVTLEWSEPVLPTSPVEITDDFESYPSWSTMETLGLGDYTLIDADGCPVGGFQNFDLPNIPYGSKQSFTLWDFSNEYFAYDQTQSDRYKAHSGDKCLVSMFTTGEDSWTEDRLISPVLSGEAQTISFYAKSLDDSAKETFQVYYSFDGTTLKDYFDNRFPRESVGGTWTKYSYDLPEGTKYFIIEHYSGGYNGGYFFFLDDLTYTPVGNETLKVDGYNIYRNNILLNESPELMTSYTDDKALEGKTLYGVRVVYDRGESPVTEVTIEDSGVEAIRMNVKVYAENSEIVVSGAEGMEFSVVATTGIVVTNRVADNITRVPVRPGIYMVTLNGETYKIVVK